MKTVPTFTAQIFLGLQEKYTGTIRAKEMAEKALQDFVDAEGLCVTVSETTYIYTKGREPGIVVGLINYPRFPATVEDIRQKAIRIAKMLRQLFAQFKVSVVFPDETVMVEEGDE